MVVLRILQECEPSGGDAEIERIDFIETEEVATPAVGGGHSSAQPDNAYANRGPLFIKIADRAPHTRFGAVVTGGSVAILRSRELRSVINGAVNQSAGSGLICVVLQVVHAQHSVIIAHRTLEALVIQMFLIADVDGERGRECDHRDARGWQHEPARPLTTPKP